MSVRRSSARAGAALFVLLSVAMHAAVWNAARRATPPLAADPPEAAVVRLVALAPSKPPPAAVPAPVVRAPASAAPASSAKPRRPAPKRTARPAAAGTPIAQASRTPTPNPAAWRGPVALPEFDDSLDVDLAFAAPPAAAPGTAAARSSGDAAPAPPDEVATAAMPVPREAQSAPPKPVHVTPASGSVRYRVHYGDPADGNVVALLEQRYEIDDHRYRLHSEGRATGIVSWIYRGTLLQESSGRVSTSGLQPERYRERRGERSEKEAVLDAGTESVRFASGAEAALPPGVQDRLSVFVQLGLLLRADPLRFAPGAVVEIPVLSNSRIEASSFRVLGSETVAAGAIDLAAVHLRRAPLDDEEPAIDLWLALEPRVLPLRVRITESSGRALDQVVVLDDVR
jgi:hypothetical protein